MSESKHKEMVINWHITEVCNYSCQYCYAKWQKQGKEVIHNNEKAHQLLNQIHSHFNSFRLDDGITFDSLRLNFAGGEPLLYADKILRTIRHAHQLGMKTSIITNGSRLDYGLMRELAPYLSVLGLSLDSFNNDSNREIGRTDRHSRLVDIGKLIDSVEIGRQVNPNLKLKLNTVVNALNWREDMNPTIFHFSPDRWKILRMLPSVTDKLAVTPSQFDAFVLRHRSLEKVITVEDNTDMTESYIMIDPYGKFFQNVDGQKNYQYSQSILAVGSKAAFSQIQWQPKKFCSRYRSEPKVSV
jgi:radical S-adenosyl methionine domain-containing protein 2